MSLRNKFSLRLLKIFFIFSLRWFEPFVMQWLNENDDMSMEYLHNALEKDRQTGVNIKIQFFYSIETFVFSFNKHLNIVYFLHQLLMSLRN